MKTKKHILLYITAAPWNLLICWPAVLLIRLFWGENLRWVSPPNQAGGPGLWCDLKVGSWPTRSWYAKYKSGSWFAFLTKEKPIEHALAHHNVWGRFVTWGATTLGHGGFFGPHAANLPYVEGDEWTSTEFHENVHVEQFEAAMLRGFLEGLLVAIVILFLGKPLAALLVGLALWVPGYWMMGAPNWLTAWLRGENPYRGSHHEESAYAQTEANHKRES